MMIWKEIYANFEKTRLFLTNLIKRYEEKCGFEEIKM